MSTDFREVMSKRTDEQLIKIVSIDRDSYQQAGIEAAEEEIKKRNIDPRKFDAIKTDLTVKHEVAASLYDAAPSTITRIVHLFIDTFAIILLDSILSYFLGFFFVSLNMPLSVWHVYLVLSIGYLAYYIILETKYQKTIGKFIMKTSVTMKDGKKPKLGTIVLRTFCRIIPLDSISFLIAVNGLHDRFSDTVVIMDSSVNLDQAQ